MTDHPHHYSLVPYEDGIDIGTCITPGCTAVKYFPRITSKHFLHRANELNDQLAAGSPVIASPSATGGGEAISTKTGRHIDYPKTRRSPRQPTPVPDSPTTPPAATLSALPHFPPWDPSWPPEVMLQWLQTFIEYCQLLLPTTPERR